MGGFFAEYGDALFLVSNTSIGLAAGAGIAKVFNELAASASLVASQWTDSLPTIIYNCMLLLVSNTSAVLAADVGIAKMFTELAATASSRGSLWMDSSPIMVVRFCGCPTPVLYWQAMLALPRCLMSWQPLPV